MMEYISDSERRYRIRESMQILGEQADMILELCGQINACLDNPSEPYYKRICEICEVLSEVTNKNKQLIEEVRNQMAKIGEEEISH